MPLTVWKSRAVSKSQITLPSAEYPRKCPSMEAENPLRSRMFLPGTYRLEATPAAAALRTQQVREADGFPDMRISTSGKQVFPENLDANPEKSGFCGKSSTPAHVRFFLSHSFLFASAQLRLRWHSPCARRRQQEVADRKPGGCERPRGHNPRAVVTGFKIYMRCARRTVPPGRKLAP